MPYRAFTPQTSGFAYTKDEMLQIYRDGHFKDAEFTDKFQHVANATTPEFLIPLALLPIESEEAELRLNPVVTGNPQGPGGRGRGDGFQDRGGRGGKGGKGERGGKGEKGSRGDGEWGRKGAMSGDVRNSGGNAWQHEPRLSGEERDGGGRREAARRRPAGAPSPPPPPKDWYYRDLEGNVQGPFSEAQIRSGSTRRTCPPTS